MTMPGVREIGSEFWSLKEPSAGTAPWERYAGDTAFFVSGRSALYAILADIKATHPCRTAYLPAYCCESMVDPFLRHGMQVSFYPIDAANGMQAQIDPAFPCDILLTMDYFGFRTPACTLPQAVHIHDVTHSLWSSPAYPDADYYFGSLRKWSAVAGAGFACKTAGRLTIRPTAAEHTAYLALRNQGYALKEQYMDAGQGDKQAFLKAFEQAEELLDRDYIGYPAEERSLRHACQAKENADTRRRHAAQLLTALQTCRLVKPLFPQLHAEDVPLFLPVLVGKGQRNALKRFLIEHQVYCPAHWPSHNGCDGVLYTDELSLICDQRYTPEDIQREIDLIMEFERKYGEIL